MAKNITFNYKGTDYTLEFTRKTREQMEDRGFIAADLLTKPMIVLPDLFAGSFLANHKFVKKSLIDEIFGLFSSKQALFEKLAEMYAEPLEELMEDTDEGNAIEWDASF